MNPFTRAFVSSAHVLNYVNVTALRPPLTLELRQDFSAVRRPFKYGGMFSIVSRPDNVGDEFHAVAHFYMHAFLGFGLHCRLTQFGIKRTWIYQERFITGSDRSQPLRRNIPGGE